jgi:hypothetical protein
MINFKNITQAAETLLIQNVGDDYVIERNAVRAADAFRVMRDGKKGWIGIYRGNLKYDAHTVGATPWMVQVRFVLEIQVASVKSADDCEDKLCDAEKEIIDILETNRKGGKIGGYVDNIIGYEIDYEMNEAEATYYQAALITVIAEVRT